jgi:hypothetical protein
MRALLEGRPLDEWSPLVRGHVRALGLDVFWRPRYRLARELGCSHAAAERAWMLGVAMDVLARCGRVAVGGVGVLLLAELENYGHPDAANGVTHFGAMSFQGSMLPGEVPLVDEFLVFFPPGRRCWLLTGQPW